MIVNKSILQTMGVCQESLQHFVDVVAKGDVDFQMSLDDSIHYLEELAKDNPELESWVAYVQAFKTDPKYIKATSEYILGTYDVSGSDFSTFEEAVSEQNRLYEQEINSRVSLFRQSSFIYASEQFNGDEKLIQTNKQIQGVNKYLVFNGNSGVYSTFLSFEDAVAFFNGLEGYVRNEVAKPSIRQKINSVDGVFQGFDIVEQ